MKNFELIQLGIDTAPLLSALSQHPELWNQKDYRKRGNSAHLLVNDIIVRFDNPANYTGGMDCINYDPYNVLCPALDNLINTVKGLTQSTKVGRAVITKISPGHGVTPHPDTEDSVHHFKRYHVCLYGAKDNMFTSGDETVEMLTGELWWFENKIVHSCKNQGVEDRVHLILDIA